MPRNPENRRVEILLSPEQYRVLKQYVEAEGFIVDADAPGGKVAIAEAIRDLFDWYIPGFAEASPLVGRGKYKRKEKRLKYHCPNCDSLDTRFIGDEGSDPILAMWYRCGNCGREFRDEDAKAEYVEVDV